MLGYFIDREHEPGCDVFWGSWFYVHPDAHGTGAGLALWEFMQERLREVGCRKLYANVSSDPIYDRARRFYTAGRFTLEHVHRDYFKPGEHSEIWACRLEPRREGKPAPAAPPADEVEPAAPLRLKEAQPRHAQDIVRLFEPYGRRHRVRADAYVWKHFAWDESGRRRLYVAGMRGEGVVGVAGVERADEEEVDKEVFWVRHLCARPGYVRAAAPLLLDRIEERQRARTARRLYTSTPEVAAYQPIVRAFEAAGFRYEGSLPDYYADGVGRAFYVKELRAPHVERVEVASVDGLERGAESEPAGGDGP
jgi:GNAT superfamily N-acetyltransferase